VIAAVLLAAGGARRFGTQKLVALFDGVPLVRHAAETLSRVTDEVIVVVGNEHAQVRAALDGLAARIVENPSWAQGMATSLRCGLGAAPASAECVLIALGDQPGIDAEVVRAVIARWRETGRPIVVARYGDGRGHPVLFAREMFDQLMTLEGDQGARSLIEQSPDRVAFVDVAGAAPRDVDTVEDLRGLYLGGSERYA
jgi:molybdenum cofactor cytidylyltransferase